MPTKTAIKRPITTIMVMLVFILAGLVSLSALKLDLMPSINIPIAAVSTTYVGAGPEEIESLVTKPVEEALGTVSNVDTITSTSSANSSMVIVQFVDGTDVDMAAIDLREKIDLVKSSLPEGANDPMVIKMDPSMLSSIMVGVHGDMDLSKLTTEIEDHVINRLERIDGVASVSMTGSVDQEVQVVLKPEKMQGYNVTVQQISGMLQAENLNLPTGSIAQGDAKLQLRSVGQFESVDEIRDLPITTSTGALIHLRDVADVKEVEKEEDSYALIDGQKSIILTIQKQSNANLVDISEKIVEELDKIEADDPELDVTMLTNTADYITTSVSNVLSTAVQAALMAMVVLFLFLRNGKSSLIIGVSIPTSVIVTFALMYVCGMSLNVISLGGLTIGIGMLVDNSTVVLEAITRHHEEGMSARKAAETGTAEVALSVMASTLTTVAVFIPLMFVQGMIGQMFKDLSLTVSFSLGVSLIVSVTFVPMAASRLLKSTDAERMEKHPRLHAFLNLWKRGLDALDSGYRRVLHASLRHKKRVVALVLLIFVASLSLLPVVGVNLIPSMDQGSASISIAMPKGTVLSETSKVVDQVTAQLGDIPEIDEWYVTAGGSSTDSASVTINLVGMDQRDRSTDEVVDEIRGRVKGIAGAEITASASSSAMGSFGSSSDVQFQLNGDDTEQLRAIGNDLMEQLEKEPWVTDVSSSLDDAVPEASIVIDRVKASSYGITASSIASAVSTAVTGSVPTQYKVDGDEIDVRIMEDPDRIRYLNDLQGITVPAANGSPIPLTEVAEIRVADGATQITRTNQHRYITISANTTDIDSATARRNTEAVLDRYHFPEGYDYEFTGTMDSIVETFTSLLVVLIVAILLVYMIMAAQFESFIHPFIIMFSLPLALTGGIMGLFVTGNTITATSFMGFIMLVGMVVNNAIVLVDYTNQLRERGMGCVEALEKAGPTRLRPILMTTLTTVLGMVPMALSTAEGTEMQRPMAITIIFGMTLSTVITLVFIPVLYAGVDKFRHGRKSKKNKRKFHEGQRGEAMPEGM